MEKGNKDLKIVYTFDDDNHLFVDTESLVRAMRNVSKEADSDEEKFLLACSDYLNEVFADIKLNHTFNEKDEKEEKKEKDDGKMFEE